MLSIVLVHGIHITRKTRCSSRRFREDLQRWLIIWRGKRMKKDYTVWSYGHLKSEEIGRISIEVFKICNGLSRLKLNELFTQADNTSGIRGHSWKLVKLRCTRDCCKYFFPNRVINRWNQLDQGVVDASSINAFKGWLDEIRVTRMGFFMDWSAEP